MLKFVRTMKRLKKALAVLVQFNSITETIGARRERGAETIQRKNGSVGAEARDQMGRKALPKTRQNRDFQNGNAHS
jgi:hypothetical protein